MREQRNIQPVPLRPFEYQYNSIYEDENISRIISGLWYTKETNLNIMYNYRRIKCYQIKNKPDVRNTIQKLVIGLWYQNSLFKNIKKKN